jgi:hypothetical protein
LVCCTEENLATLRLNLVASQKIIFLEWVFLCWKRWKAVSRITNAYLTFSARYLKKIVEKIHSSRWWQIHFRVRRMKKNFSAARNVFGEWPKCSKTYLTLRPTSKFFT